MSVELYQAAFERERAVEYPVMDALEARYGYALDRARMEAAARVLACPLKANPPNWQHGRMVYAVTREYLHRQVGPVDEEGRWQPFAASLLDVGTAKGFSALCLLWAINDAVGAGDDVAGCVTSVDVLDPSEKVRRNTVAEVDGYKTLAEILAPWPEAQDIEFLKSTGLEWLRAGRERVHVAFIDGKHTAEVVAEEGRTLAKRQIAGDVVMFDDLQIAGVWHAVESLRPLYDLERVSLGNGRVYAVGVRRG